MFLRIACLVLVAVPALFGATPEVDSSQLPRVPATPPDKALDTFKLKSGFRLDLVAAEPLVIDPIAMSFDEDGRLYVVEMRDYSERRPERLGRIRLLEDTDGDGRFDKSTVFAGNLPWPTAVTCWAGGIFVGSTPDILWMKDTNGDGVADEREVIITGFAADFAPFATNKLNVQALMNSFQWTLENRIHGATSFSGGRVKLVDSPFVRSWLKRAEASPSPGGEGRGEGGRNPTRSANSSSPLDLRGRDFSFDPRTLEMRAESGGGQHGMSFDDRGRKFVCSNSKHLQMVMYEERYAARNPDFLLPSALIDIAVDGGAAPVFRISPDEPWRVIRTQWRVAGLAPGPVEGGGRASGYFTGATGVTIYRGDAYGPEFVGDAFIGDAGGNLVHRKKLLPDGIGLRAERPSDEQNVEFLASTDNWFRPVQFANAPDGCLYLADMYREVIEHPWSLPESLKKHLDLNSGNDRGRLYRIVPEKFQQRPLPRLSKASTAELVKLLEHPNGWHRDTAARLLFERQDESTVPALRELFRATQSPRARLHALYSWDGLQAVADDQLVKAIGSGDESLEIHGLRLAEGRTLTEEMRRAIGTTLLRAKPDVQLQLLLSLRQWDGADALEWMWAIAGQGADDPWVRAALLHAVGDDAVALFLRLTGDAGQVRRENGWPVAGELARLAGAVASDEQRRKIINSLNATAAGSSVRLELAASFCEGRRSSAKTNSPGLPRSWFAEAGRIAEDTQQPVSLRVCAVRLLGQSEEGEAPSTLYALLEARHPAEIQSAALTAVGRWTGEATAASVLKRWTALGPAGRGEAVALLLKRPERVKALLAAMTNGVVRPGELSPAQQAQLRSHRDAAIRQQAVKVLGRMPTGSRQAVVELFAPSLKLTGDVYKGRKFFQSRCATCHKLGGDGFVLGPDLVTVKNAGKEKLLTNILDPNREVNSNYLGYLVETKDGDSYVGIVASENAAGVTLRLAGGLEQSIARSNIATMQSQGRSLMPEGLEEGLSQQDMADLLEFILAP